MAVTLEECEELEKINDERVARLAADGATIPPGQTVTRYQTLLLEAIVGQGVALRCRYETAEWMAERLTEAEEQVAKLRREAALLAPMPTAPNGVGPNRQQRRHPS